MRMEDRKGLMGRERDQFPVGMRILAVDDDPVCLKVLETLLRRCQYHVTTTNQAITALKILTENKDMFDLVISDVHMLDMDGFKLHELVGLEMDLPVIMLSVNGETKTVMKGITHGACDYLLKPVRIEELRNIWQHVVRRKFSNRECNNLDFYKEFNKPPSADSYHAPSQVICGPSDQSGRVSKKRKELHSEEEDEGEENDIQENDEPSAAKKPRVVWSVELHRKFVAAVNQLGIDKAVPKIILEIMNVEKLTRENVASHLQAVHGAVVVAVLVSCCFSSWHMREAMSDDTTSTTDAALAHVAGSMRPLLEANRSAFAVADALALHLASNRPSFSYACIRCWLGYRTPASAASRSRTIAPRTATRQRKWRRRVRSRR